MERCLFSSTLSLLATRFIAPRAGSAAYIGPAINQFSPPTMQHRSLLNVLIFSYRSVPAGAQLFRLLCDPFTPFWHPLTSHRLHISLHSRIEEFLQLYHCLSLFLFIMSHHHHCICSCLFPLVLFIFWSFGFPIHPFSLISCTLFSLSLSHSVSSLSLLTLSHRRLHFWVVSFGARSFYHAISDPLNTLLRRPCLLKPNIHIKPHVNRRFTLFLTQNYRMRTIVISCCSD